jgi:hypothetical protein
VFLFSIFLRIIKCFCQVSSLSLLCLDVLQNIKMMLTTSGFQFKNSVVSVHLVLSCVGLHNLVYVGLYNLTV